MKKVFSFLLLFIIIIIVGCTQENGSIVITPTTASKGLNIINFTSSFDTIRIQESTNINLKLKNVGDFNARNITAILYGYGLLEKTDLKNESEVVLSGSKEDVLSWFLKAPITLSQTEVTSYPVNARVFYLYNFSGFQQIAFVPTAFVGEAPAIYSATAKGPLSVNIESLNPIRSLAGQGIDFSITIEINNDEKGRVNYYNDSQRSYHLNELMVKVPSNWTPLEDLSAWNVTPQDETKLYKLNFDELQEKYYAETYDCPFDNPCPRLEDQRPWAACGLGGCCCACNETNAAECTLINNGISNLWMIRGEKARLLLLFHHDDVAIPTIDIVEVTGSYGYEVDTSDFTGPRTITIRGD